MEEIELLKRLDDIKDSRTIDEVVDKVNDLMLKRWGPNSDTGISSDDPSTEIHQGTRVIYRGRTIGEVLVIQRYPKGIPLFYVKADSSGTIFVAEAADLQNIDDKREG